jgi:hypothetical protein
MCTVNGIDGEENALVCGYRTWNDYTKALSFSAKVMQRLEVKVPSERGLSHT